MILGIGTDLADRRRFLRISERYGRRFAQKILTERELERFSSFGHSVKCANYLAKQFAAKEAIAKALGTGFGLGVHPTQIEVLRLDSGAPVVHLSRAASARSESLGIDRWWLTLSDDGDYALAFAIGEGSRMKSIS